jgi:hypothetical protein
MANGKPARTSMRGDFLLKGTPAAMDVQIQFTDERFKAAADGATRDAGRQIAEKTRQWCLARGLTPNPRLDDAAEVLFTITAVQKRHLTSEDLNAKVKAMVARDSDHAEGDFKAALEQVKQCMQALGLANSD